MPLPIFLPCAAGVEALLESEVRGLLPAARLTAQRGGVALAGEPREIMLLNLESRLSQRGRRLCARPQRRMVRLDHAAADAARRYDGAKEPPQKPQLRGPARQG